LDELVVLYLETKNTVFRMKVLNGKEKYMRKRMVTKFMALAAVAMVGTGMMAPVMAHAEEIQDAPTNEVSSTPEYVVTDEKTPIEESIRRSEEIAFAARDRRLAEEAAARQAATSTSTQTSSPAPEQAPASVPTPTPSVVENTTTEEPKVEVPKKSVASSDDKVKAEVKTENEVKDDETETNVEFESESEKKVDEAVSAARRANDKIKANAEALTKIVEDEPTGMEAVVVTLKTTVGNGVAAVQTFFGNVADGIQGLFEGFVSLF